MGYKDAKKREYQLLWIKKRREEWIAQNGPCAHCGSTDNLQVDHKEPRAKNGGMSPAQIWSRRKEVRDQELAKCQVLCGNCHKKKTAQEVTTQEHGSTLYRNGCRCRKCRNTQRDKSRRLRGTKPENYKKNRLS